MKSKFLVFVAILFLTSCGTNESLVSSPSTTFPLKSEKTSSTQTGSPVIPLSMTPTFEGSRVGGIVGVFAPVKPSSTPPSALNHFIFYDILRFYENGLVIGAKVGINTDTVNESWPKIRVGFNQDNDGLARGTYYILDEHIWFNMSDTGNMMATDYSGVFLDSKLILNFYNHRDGSQGKEIEYFMLDSGIP